MRVGIARTCAALAVGVGVLFLCSFISWLIGGAPKEVPQSTGMATVVLTFAWVSLRFFRRKPHFRI